MGYGNGILKNKSFTKILICFICMLIPVISIGLVNYLITRQLLHKEVERTIQTSVGNGVEQIENTIIEAQYLAAELFYDEIMGRLIVKEDHMTLDILAELPKIPRIIGRKKNLMGSQIYSVAIYADASRVYTDSGIFPFADYFKTFYRYQDYDYGYWQTLQEDCSVNMLVLECTELETFGGTRQKMVPIVLRETVNGLTYTIIVNLNVQNLSRMLSKNFIYEGTQYAVIGRDGETLYESTPMEQLSNRNYKRIHQSLEMLGWTVEVYVPLRIINRRINKDLFFILLSGVGVLGAGFLLSLRLSYKIYNPIYNLCCHLREPGHKMEGRNAKGGIFDELYTDVLSLQRKGIQQDNSVSDITDRLIDSFFYILLSTGRVYDDAFVHQVILPQLGFCNRLFLCISIQFELTTAFFEENVLEDEETLRNCIKQFFQHLFRKKFPVYIHQSQSNRFTCIANINEEQLGTVDYICGLISDLFAFDKRYCTITVTISCPCTNLEQLYHRNQQCLSASSFQKGDQFFQIIHAEEDRLPNGITYMDELRLSSALKSGNLDEVRQGLSRLHQQLLERETLPEAVAPILLKTGEEILSRLADAGEGKSPLGQQLLVTKTLDDLFDCAFAYYVEILDRSSQGRTQEASLSDRTMIHIQSHYHQQISLDTVADSLGISPKYLSKVFKEQTGINMTHYINWYRIERVKELLINSNLRIADISELVGLPSRTSFIRAFKKLEGMTPQEYRTKYSHKLSAQEDKQDDI